MLEIASKSPGASNIFRIDVWDVAAGGVQVAVALISANAFASANVAQIFSLTWENTACRFESTYIFCMRYF